MERRTTLTCLLGILACLSLASVCKARLDERRIRCPSSNLLPYTTEMLPHPYQDLCFQFVHRETYWATARDFCRRYGGRLLTIPDANTNFFITDKLNRLPWKNRGVWIGLHDRDDEMVWEWSTESENVGQKVTWTNWGRGHPRASFHGIRDCVRMVRGSGTWRWHETPCALLNWKYRSICQYQMMPSTAARVGFTTPKTTPRPTTTKTTVITTQAPTTAFKYGVGADGRFSLLNGDTFKGTKSTFSAEVTTEADDIDIVVPLQLQQDNDASDTNMLGGVAVACLIMVLLALLVITVVYFRRRRQKKGIPTSLIVENSTYHGSDCGGTPTVVAANGQTTLLKVKAMQENEYTDEPQGGGPGVILPYTDDMGDEKYSEIKPVYTSPAHQNTVSEEVENALNTKTLQHEYADPYDVPKISSSIRTRPRISAPCEYLPMDRQKVSATKRPAFPASIGDYLEPVSSSRVSNVYAEIPEDEDGFLTENVYECLDDIKRDIP